MMLLLETWAAALQASALSRTLRASLWLYPLVNTAHLVGIALLFGAIVPLDLRLAGCWKSVPLHPLARTAVPVAVAGLLLALATGALLFATRPLDYLREPLFGLKMALLGAAVLNALLQRRAPPWQAPGTTVRPAWVAAGVASIVLWLGVIAAGRLIGYR